MVISIIVLLMSVVVMQTTMQEKDRGEMAFPMMKIKAERLPDLNTPRAGHASFCIGDELFVAGGHTTGFVPTATAEYFANDQWHTIQMTYSHDNGLYVKLASGKVLLAGGHERDLGIGQTFGAELYDPATHTFGNYGCLEMKRSLAAGTEIDSGRVIISGNWYAQDGIELFDGKKSFSIVKPVSVKRTSPFILRTTRNNAIILGSEGVRGEMLGDSTAIIDRLQGEPFTVPLLKQWKPVNFSIPARYNNDGFIGDESKDIYAYLLLAKDSIVYDTMPEQQGHSLGQTTILMVRDTTFSLLPTTYPIPSKTSIGGLIYWYSPVIADRNIQRAYLAGIDKDKRLYLLYVDYAETPAPLALYYTDPLPDCGFNTPVLTAEGNLVIMGGNFHTGFTSENYTPYASTYLIRLGNGSHLPTAASISWRWILFILFIIIAALAVLLYYNHLRHMEKSSEQIEKNATNGIPASKSDTALLHRICDLMEQQQLFRNPELKVADVASALNTNTRYVIDCIKADRNQTFSQFVNSYRIEYAKRQLRLNPNKIIMEIYSDAGFSSERSFFRSFKDTTGMTTREWMSLQTD
ncbi:MAG: helix-turn-helix domain-containing protein [Bacteroidaceae bacterium]|nr:helix-turn-helix domain-containing protein [Bacteroidaceae bacterium]